MKRVALLFLILAVAGVAIFFLMRRESAVASGGVASLLPGDTALLIHVPDAEADRDAWHRTDLYQLYREPAVQDFLGKPATQLQKSGAAAETWRDFSALRLRDGFLATRTVDAPFQFIGGFEFRCGEREAEAIIEKWRSRWSEANRSSISYARRNIEITTAPRLTVASAIISHRFFFATNIDDLKALLDRLDGRSGSAPLNADENFRAAMKQMPADYAALLYLQPKSLAQKLVALRAQSGRALPAGQETMIERMESFTHVMMFEGGKLRDIDFVRMPRLVETKLERKTLEAVSSGTLFYLALIVTARQQLASSGNTSFFPGVTAEDWQAAFGDEMSLLVAWPENARLPAAVATLAVRDAARARKIVRSIGVTDGGSAENGTEFFALPAVGPFSAVRPVLALSAGRLALGLDRAGVEQVMSPSSKTGKLTKANGYQELSHLVPDPQVMFAWLDLAAFYSRLDSTLRPLLQLSAAFMPASRFDLNKLPPPEIVTKHLSPVIASQSYTDGGYRSESVGPITLDQAVLLAIGGYAGWEIFQKHGDVRDAWKVLKLNAVPGATP